MAAKRPPLPRSAGVSPRIAVAAEAPDTITVSEINDTCATGDGTIPKYSCVNPVIPSAEATVNLGGTPPPATGAPAPQAPTISPVEIATQAWTTQKFAKPGASLQPVGNITLPGLATYFEASFPAAGLAPGESVTVTMLGQQVSLRPRSVQYTYHFGDGTSFGPTPNRGGPYPTGTVRHTYQRKGTVTVRIDVTLSGEFSIDGGAWQPIPGTTTVQGTPSTLQVRPLQSRLTT